MQNPEDKNRLLKILGAVIGAIVLIFLAFQIFAPKTTIISGAIQYNGMTPQDPSVGKVVVEEREVGDQNYETAVDNVPAKQGASWIWEGAKEGKNYQIQAYFVYKDKKIANSEAVAVSAPSVNQTLTFNVTQKELPPEESATQPTDTTISGKLHINGYIPDGSTVSVYGKEKDASDFQLLATAPATDGKPLSWNAPEAGVYYTFQGEMYDPQGTLIGESEYITIASPADNQVMTIDSTAKAPEESKEKTSITGTVTLNGPIPHNSELFIQQRKQGEGQFTGVQRIAATNGARWTFAEADSGQAYEITATLQLNKEDTAKGNVIQATAPASDEVLTINTNFSLQPPAYPPTVACGTESNGKFNSTLTFSAVKNASQYYLRAGTTQGASDLLGERVSNTNDAHVNRTVLVGNGQQVYSNYAYTFDASCTSQSCFSASSPTLIFKCPH